MVNVVLVLVVVVVATSIGFLVNRHRHGIVAERGMSIGADLGTMGDQPRVRVRGVTVAAPDRVRLVLTADPDGRDGSGPVPDLELLVAMREAEFGFDLLHRWQQSGASLAIVMRPDNRIVRLRSIDDLQPLTLRRIDE